MDEMLQAQLDHLRETITQRDRNGWNAPAIYRCPACQDTGEVSWKDAEGRWWAKPCKCREAKKAEAYLQRSGIVNKEDYSLDKFRAAWPWQLRLKEAANKYLAEKSKAWFFVGGQVGAGKTHLCSGICLALIDSGIKVRYETWPNLAQEMKVERRDTAFAVRMQELTQVKVLYLDDLFHGRISQADQDLAFEIIDGRYKADRPTIISTELYMRDLMDLNEAIGSRIHEKAPAEFRCTIARDTSRNHRLMQA